MLEPKGYFPEYQKATLDNGRKVDFEYLCIACGKMHKRGKSCSVLDHKEDSSDNS